MAWARLDDSFHDHPKVVGLPLGAVGLYTLCLTWAHRHARKAAVKGFVSRAVACRLGGSDEIAVQLADAGLWEPVDGGWVIHDFEDYLRADDPAAKAEAGRRGAAARWQTDGKPMADRMAEPSQTDDEPPADQKQTNGSRASARSFPTRTQPKDLTTTPAVSSARETRGTRLPEPFEITDEMREWAREHDALSPRWLEDHTERFRDYWRGVPGAKGRKLDWVGTWRNWIKSEVDKGQRPVSPIVARAGPNGRPTTDDKIRNTIALGKALDQQQRREIAP